MRVDEEYAKKSIKVYLESISYPPFEIVPGGDPPDYYCVDSSGNKTPLEITTAESIYKDENEKSKKRTSTETLIKFCNQLDNKYKNLVPKGKSIMLVFKVPVKNFNKFKKGLVRTLDKLIRKNKPPGNRNLKIYGEIVEVHEISHGDNRRKAIIGAITDKNPIIVIQEQTQLILDKIIKEKESKLKEINSNNGEKWLGVINNYPLADANIFKTAINGINHNFTRIFLIEENNKVSEIMNSN
ncbi:TPA: hypothetical protein DCZ81_02380 [Candidatus Collierbacteria bacterium]|nr:hypothetical protein [Candidatus Collierbacteria bacterium]HCX25911.1 hypothetical protein [Candidatus Collierbacteria bacterium]